VTSYENILNEFDNFVCTGCGKKLFESGCVRAVDYYMLTDDLWKKIADDLDKMLCMACAEKRIGHTIVKDDLKPCPVNEHHPIFNKFYKRQLYRGKMNKCVTIGCGSDRLVHVEIQEEIEDDDGVLFTAKLEAVRCSNCCETYVSHDELNRAAAEHTKESR